MNELKVFQNSEFGELGVMMIDGKEYFPATQCAKILGYADPFKAVKQHCDEDGWVKRPVIDSLGRTQEMKFINEGNLYRLIVRSKLPAAKRFERWVFDEVLPEIRRTGGYGSVNIEEVITKAVTTAVSETVKAFDTTDNSSRRRLKKEWLSSASRKSDIKLTCSLLKSENRSRKCFAPASIHLKKFQNTFRSKQDCISHTLRFATTRKQISSEGDMMILSGVLRQYMDSIVSCSIRQRRAKVRVTLLGKPHTITLPVTSI